MNLKYAVNRNPVVPPPKSRVNAKIARVVADQKHAPPARPAPSDGQNAELDAVRRVLDNLVAGRYELLIFMTGNSVWSLFALAQELGRKRDLIQALQAVQTACRSPKAAAILRRLKVPPTLGEPGLYNTRRLVYSLGRLDLAGRRILRVNGAPGDLISSRLRDQRARLREFSICHRRTPIKASMSELFSLSMTRGLRDFDPFVFPAGGLAEGRRILG